MCMQGRLGRCQTPLWTPCYIFLGRYINLLSGHPNVSESIFLKTNLIAIPEEIMILFLTKVWKCLAKLMHFEPFWSLKESKWSAKSRSQVFELYSAIFLISFYQYSDWGIWGWSRKQIWPWGGSSTQGVLSGQCFGKFAPGESPSQQETFWR